MLKLKPVAIFLFVLVLICAAWFFRSDLTKTFNTAEQNLQSFQKTDLGDIIAKAGREILAPLPLHIGGKPNNVVLVKANIIAQTNLQRYDNGMLPPLIENAALSAAAKAKAEDMFKNQYFEHTSPSGLDSGTLVKNHGYDYILSGENLILGNFADEKDVVQKWMGSPGHRANILNTRFTEIGVAVTKGIYGDETVWIGVQEFGLPLSACPGPSKTLGDQIDLGNAQLDKMAVSIEAKKAEIDNAPKGSQKRATLIDEYDTLVTEYNTRLQEIKAIIVKYNKQVDTQRQCMAGK